MTVGGRGGAVTKEGEGVVGGGERIEEEDDDDED